MIWFGGLLFLFAPIMFLVVVFDPTQRLGALFGLLVVSGMLGFGILLFRFLRWFREADGRDLAELIAAAMDAEVELPAGPRQPPPAGVSSLGLRR